MRFGICPCCTVSGGIFDFYAYGGHPVFDPVPYEHQTKVSRYASRQTPISSYLTSTSEQYSTNIPTNQGEISSFWNGYWFDTWTGGKFIEPDNFEHNPVSMNIQNDERIWKQGWMQRTQDTDWFGFSGIQMESNRVIGSGAAISGNSLVLLNNDSTTGCYVKWNLPENFYASWLFFDIPYNFDKCLLLRISGISGYAEDTWFEPDKNNGINGNKSVYYTPVESGLQSFTRYEWSQFKFTESDDDYWVHLQLGLEEIIYPETIRSIEFRLVDNQTGFNIDDISGYSLELRNLHMPYKTGEFYHNQGSPSYKVLQYCDPINENILSTIVIQTGNWFSTITGNDMYQYSEIISMPVSLHNTSFALEGAQDGYFDDYDEDLFSRSFALLPNSTFSGSNVVLRPFGNTHRSSITFNSTGSIFEFTRGSQGEFRDNYPAYKPGENPRILYRPAYYHDGGIQPYSPASLSYLSAYDIDVWNCTKLTYDFSTVGLETAVSLYKTLNTDGTSGLIYCSPHLFWLAEYDVPSDEKIKQYSTWMRYYGLSGGIATDFYAVDIDNYNSDRYLPIINVFSERDAPNCFSVKFPRQHFINATGKLNRVPSGTLNQTIQILWGPAVQNNFTISALSGQMIDNYTGALQGYRNNLSGLGGVRPVVDTFSYDKVIFNPSYLDEDGLMLPSGVQSAMGNVYNFTIPLVFGSGEVFWEDSFEQNVGYSPIIDISPTPTGMWSGVWETPSIPNVSAYVIEGDIHLPTNTKAASFIYSKNHFISGNMSYVSGECYWKVKIGDNVVYNQRYYDSSQENYHDYYMPLGGSYTTGPYAIFPTESELQANLSGNYAAWVWFERLWEVSPKLAAFGSTGTQGLTTGWIMHVCGATGNELWNYRTSGWRDWEIGNNPRVVDSSDRFIYVSDFFLMGVKDVVDNIGYSTPRIRSITGETGNTIDREYFFFPSMNFSGATSSFGISHDRRGVIPVGQVGKANIRMGAYTKTVPESHYITDWEYGTGPVGSCVKNSSLLEQTPKVEDFENWQINDLFYVISGLDPYFPSGYAPISEDKYPSPHILYNTTGYNMSEYSGYVMIHSGIPYLDFETTTYWDYGYQSGPYYTHSGTTGLGWY